MKGGIWCPCVPEDSEFPWCSMHCYFFFNKYIPLVCFLFVEKLKFWSVEDEIRLMKLHVSLRTQCPLPAYFSSCFLLLFAALFWCSISVRFFHFFLSGMFLICENGKIVIYRVWCCICPRGLRLPLMQSIRGCRPIQGPPLNIIPVDMNQGRLRLKFHFFFMKIFTYLGPRCLCTFIPFHGLVSFQ